MSDVKDILGLPRGGGGSKKGGGENVQGKSREGGNKGRKGVPLGVSREVAMLTMDQDDGARRGFGATSIMPSVPVGLKERRKGSARNVFWAWKPFTSSSRNDGLTLKHWAKTKVLAPGEAPSVCDWKEYNGDYAFAKYNKKVRMVMYNDEEYNSMLSDDTLWTREETDYLFSMCENFDLRFIIIADRYDWGGRKRSVEELKARYYSCAKKLLEAREGIEEASKYIEVRVPFNVQHETERKAALDFILTRTKEQQVEDDKILEEAAAIEARRSKDVAEVVGAANAGMADAMMDGDEDVEDFLPALDGSGAAAPPGAYLRGVHTQKLVDAMLTEAGSGNQLKALDKAIEGLGVTGLQMPTRRICHAYANLRKETAAMMELQQKVAMREQELKLMQGGDEGDIFVTKPAAAKPAPVAAMVTATQQTAAAATPAPVPVPKPEVVVEVAEPAVVMTTPTATKSAVKPEPTATSTGTRTGKREGKRKTPARYQDSPSPPKKRPSKRMK